MKYEKKNYDYLIKINKINTNDFIKQSHYVYLNPNVSGGILPLSMGFEKIVALKKGNIKQL